MNDIHIIVNGGEYPADSSKNLLENILQNGLELPHLCHHEELMSYGGCGLCLVEVEGIRKPLRACSTAVTDGMKVTTDTPSLEESRRATLALLLSDHTGDCKAPCFHACPTHQDVQGYVGLIANGQEKEALELIKQDNPLPASIGRVCPHPCEKECRRRYLEGAVSICALKRFAADSYPDYIPACAKGTGKSVAVVGAGPAGLSAAYFLLLKGYAVEIFESEQKAGGMLRYGIPAYRLPKDVLDREIACIEKMGAAFHFEKRLGRDFTVSSLKERFDAVLIAVGAWKASSLHCPGDNASGVWGGIDFLYRVANGETPEIGNDVAVVGGGNTAIDAVRTAIRLGAEHVTLLYRRTEEEMPAEPEEIRDAREEGVSFRFLSAPGSVLTENGKAVGLEIQKMRLGEPDAGGRRSPVAIPGETEKVRYSAIISAIGQQVDSGCLGELVLTKKGTVQADENSFVTSVPGIFAAGDAVNRGPDIAVRAVAGGKNAAMAIDAYLNGTAFSASLPFYVKNNAFDLAVLPEMPTEKRAQTVQRNAKERARDFREAAFTLTLEQAQEEAKRCLQCGCAAVYDCQLLPLLRTYGSDALPISGKKNLHKKDDSHPFIVRDNNKCILCALCVRACSEIAGTENLGLFGRGFGTEPVSAFGLPLQQSSCVSCGACVSICPTGALTGKVLSPKNPPLPFEEEQTVCRMCERACRFTRRSVCGKTVKMLPASLGRSCSVGVFGPLLAEDEMQRSLADKDALLKKVTASMDYALLPKEAFCTFDKLMDIIRKN